MVKHHKYSIIIPCFNEEGNVCQLVKAFEPLLEKYPGVELVLVDNGSIDDTRLLIKQEIQNRKSLNRIIGVYLDKNEGYGNGILSGLKVANGEYVGWIHADLQFSPLAFDKMIHYIEANEGLGEGLFLKGIRQGRPFIDKFFTFGMSIFESVLFFRFLWDINGQPTLFSRRLYDQYRTFAPKDFSLDLFFFVIARSKSVKVVRFPIWQCDRQSGESSWNKGVISRMILIGRTLKFSFKLWGQLFLKQAA